MYVALERLIIVKVIAVGIVIALGVAFVITADTWRALPGGLVGVGQVPIELGFALLLGAVAFAGAGGGQNLCQSNWIRDKGFGMGQYVPRLVSPLTGRVTGDVEARAGSAFIFETTPGNMMRWRRWWRFANVEQSLTFVLVTIVTICLTSMLAHSTLVGRPGLPQTVAFLQIEGRRFQEIVGPWFGLLFWGIGSFSLFASSMGIADYTSRLAADILKSTYLRVLDCFREPPVFLARVGTGGARVSHSARRRRSAARPARHFGVGRRDHDVPVLDAAAGLEPARSARGDPSAIGTGSQRSSGRRRSLVSSPA